LECDYVPVKKSKFRRVWKIIGHKLFTNDAYLMQNLRHACTTESEIIFRIASISSIIDKEDKDGISSDLKNIHMRGSINLIEAFLKGKK